MKFDLINLLTDDVPRMVAFYRDVLGFAVKDDSWPGYVELDSEGARFAICDRTILYQATRSEEYRQQRRGQTFELAFPCATAEQVDKNYEAVVQAGAGPVMPPTDHAWGQRTACFSDPDGNIHEFYYNLTA